MTDKEKNIADRLKDIAEECYKDKELMPISVILFSLLGALYGGTNYLLYAICIEIR